MCERFIELTEIPQQFCCKVQSFFFFGMPCSKLYVYSIWLKQSLDAVTCFQLLICGDRSPAESSRTSVVTVSDVTGHLIVRITEWRQNSSPHSSVCICTEKVQPLCPLLFCYAMSRLLKMEWEAKINNNPVKQLKGWVRDWSPFHFQKSLSLSRSSLQRDEQLTDKEPTNVTACKPSAVTYLNVTVPNRSRPQRAFRVWQRHLRQALLFVPSHQVW